MKTPYKVGQKVKIIECPPPSENWNRGPGWNADMSKLCGKESYISRVNTYSKNVYLLKGFQFSFCGEWLVPIGCTCNFHTLQIDGCQCGVIVGDKT